MSLTIENNYEVDRVANRDKLSLGVGLSNSSRLTDGGQIESDRILQQDCVSPVQVGQ